MANKISTKTPDTSKSFHEQIEEVRGLVEENLRYTKSLHEFVPKDEKKEKEELKEVLEKNLEYSKAIYFLLQKIDRWVIWQRIWRIIKILIIVIPIILGILFLPPWLKKTFSSYQELLNTNSVQLNQELLNVNSAIFQQPQKQ